MFIRSLAGSYYVPPVDYNTKSRGAWSSFPFGVSQERCSSISRRVARSPTMASRHDRPPFFRGSFISFADPSPVFQSFCVLLCPLYFPVTIYFSVSLLSISPFLCFSVSVSFLSIFLSSILLLSVPLFLYLLFIYFVIYLFSSPFPCPYFFIRLPRCLLLPLVLPTCSRSLVPCPSAL